MINKLVCDFIFQWVQVPSCGLTNRSVASRKLVWGNPNSEGSEPAKVGTDEQEVHKRLQNEDKRPQQRNVRRKQKSFYSRCIGN